MRGRIQLAWRGVLAAVICLSVLQPRRGEAATIVVTTLADSGPGSLRAAIGNANSGDTITFAINGTITNLTAELLVARDLVIVGPGPNSVAVSGNNSSRVFNILAGATVTLSGLRICNGRAHDGAAGTNSFTPGWPGEDGGGIYNSGTLTLTNCVVTRCSSGKGGAGFSTVLTIPPVTTGPSSGGSGGNGGGICNVGTLTLAACTLSSNTNGKGGNGGSERVAMYPGAVGASGGSGGGLYDVGAVTIIASTFSSNSAGVGGSGGAGGAGVSTQISGGAGGRGGEGGFGGAFYSLSSPTLLCSTLAGNCSGAGGQGGTGGIGYSGFNPSMVGGPGGVGGDGGSAGSGAGLFCTGFFEAVACTLTGNVSAKGGTGGGGGSGGGNSRGAGGNGGNGGSGGSGGGGGGASTWGWSASLRNVLAAQNSAGVGGLGGTGGPGGLGSPFGSAGYAGSSGLGGSGPDLVGAFASNGHNLVGLGDGNSGFIDGVLGDIVGSGIAVDPLLGPLANNGGSVMTCALLSGSPALDSGDDTLADVPWNLTADQRGLPRQSGLHVDIGALEVQWASSPLRVATCARTSDGTIQITLTNVVGASLTVLAATNPSSLLSDWIALGSFSEIAPGVFRFSDPASASLPRRFYRVRSP